MSNLKILLAFLLFLVLDSIWLYFNKNEFENLIVMVQRVIMIPNNLAIVIAYIILLFGLYWFILKNRRSVLDAFLLGVLVNGTYEFTNMATLKKWYLSIAIKDTLWGGVLWATVTYITYNFF